VKKESILWGFRTNVDRRQDYAPFKVKAIEPKKRFELFQWKRPEAEI
jgi:hypothetical protein